MGNYIRAGVGLSYYCLPLQANVRKIVIRSINGLPVGLARIWPSASTTSFRLAFSVSTIVPGNVTLAYTPSVILTYFWYFKGSSSLTAISS